MKPNYLKLTTIFLAGLAAFFAFKYFTRIEGSLEVDKKKCSTCYTYNNTSTKPYALDLNLLKTMALEYQSSSLTSSAGSTVPQNRSVWFSIEQLKQFIFQIESNTCNCDSSLGIRFYFAKYPRDNFWTSPTAFKSDLDNIASGDFRNKIIAKYSTVPGLPTHGNIYEMMNTLFLVPTIKVGNKNMDFDPNGSKQCVFGYDIKKTGDYGKLDSMRSSYYGLKSGTSVAALMATNHGDNCPPPIPPARNCGENGSFFDY